jgi:hypothetical protein
MPLHFAQGPQEPSAGKAAYVPVLLLGYGRLHEVESIKRLLRRPGRDDFAQMVMDAIRRAGYTDPIQYDRQTFKLVMAGGNHAYLANAYSDCLKAPNRQRAQIVARYAAAWVTVRQRSVAREPLPLEEVLPNLLPIVRTRSFHDTLRLQARVERLEEQDVPLVPLADHLAVSLAVDWPTTSTYVDREKLSGWGISFDDALESARDNLWKASGGRFTRPVAGVYIAPWREDYDSSRLFLYDLLWHLDVNGDHVAAVPSRETLIVTGSEDYAGLAMMAELCEKLQNCPRPISCIPVILRGKTWATYQPETGHPECESFKKLRIIEEARDYADQNQLLSRLHHIIGDDVFVAPYLAVKYDAIGTYTSDTVWTEGISILLPKADRVAFDRNGRIVGKAPWERVREIVGDLMQPLDMHPVRFKLERFPSPQQLAAILG